ncbi:MAG: hypothetical protein DRP42_01235 [Tenericutes bacterium]|nr:MAG: hypothetical protein DRP42_01235 [Mycoplasmatota bacterium]
MIDTHAHLLKGKYENTNVKDLIEKELKNTDFIVNVAYDLESSLEISSQVKNHNNLYGAIGIHPSHADKSINIDPKTIMTKLGKLLVNEVAQGTQKIVAIGETGLDFSKEDYNEENQIK